jgi:hypothetical protein
MSLDSLDRAMKGSIDLSVGDIIAKYGDKQAIAMAVQKGEIADVAKAVMAGMAIDRIAASAMQPPTTTVAEDTFAPPQPQMDMGVEAAAQMQGQPQMPGQPQGQGIDQIPVPEQMFSAPQGMASGGIVAFQAGASVNLPMSKRLQLREQMTPQEKEIFDRTGKIPDRIQAPDLRAPVRMEGGRPIPVDLSTGQELGKALPSTQELAINQTAMPSAGLSNIPIDQILQRAESFATGIKPESQITVPSVETASDTTKQLLEASGYNENVLEDIKRDLQKQRESATSDRKEAMNLRLIEAGLGIMGGESPYAFANIGKGASGALKGLAEDLKEIKKSDRELRLAEQNLMLKQNEAAIGRAGITQKSIERAQDRADRASENNAKLKGEVAKTMLSGEIQERIARSTYSNRMTDFDKKWKIYTDSLPKGEKATPEGFGRMWGESRFSITEKEATRMANDALKAMFLDPTTPEGQAKFNELKRYYLQQGSASGAMPSGPTPPLPSGFVLQGA